MARLIQPYSSAVLPSKSSAPRADGRIRDAAEELTATLQGRVTSHHGFQLEKRKKSQSGQDIAFAIRNDRQQYGSDLRSQRRCGLLVGPMTHNRAGDKGEKKSWGRRD